MVEEYRSLVSHLRVQTGSGLRECARAIEKFDGNMEMAAEYLSMKGHAVAHKTKDGRFWVDEDYVRYVKEMYNDGKV